MRSRINNEQAKEMRELRALGVSVGDLAKRYDITYRAALLTVKGERWKDAGGPIDKTEYDPPGWRDVPLRHALAALARYYGVSVRELREWLEALQARGPSLLTGDGVVDDDTDVDAEELERALRRRSEG